MSHPSIEDIVGGTATAHVARCDTCRKLAELAGVTIEAADDHDSIPRVDERYYTDWTKLADARGGMGQIFRVRDRRLGRYVAIKQMRGSDAERAASVPRFEQEARLTARLQHPAIVGVYEAGRFGDGEPFYAMPLLAGQPLSAKISAAARLDDRLALVPNVTTVAEALAYAHGEGIVHRDVKPDNILVGNFGETVLIDWGLAKDLAEATAGGDGAYRSPPPTDGLTQLGVGTAHYMPPEQARGEAPDPRTDVYALGATLYHVLAGKPPFQGDGATAVRRSLADGERPDELAADVPRELVDIVAKAMSQVIGDRYASAREFADELKRWQTGQLLTSRRYTPAELFRHWLRRHRTALRITAIAGAALFAIAVVAFVRIARERDAADRERDNAARERDRAEIELRRANATVASRTAADPLRRLDALELAAHAVANGPPVQEVTQGLVDVLAAGPPVVPLPHDGVVKGFANTGGTLLGVDDARSLVVWSAASGKKLAQWPLALPQPEKVVVGPNRRQVVVCGWDPIAEVYDLESGAHASFETKANIEGCAWLDDGRLITAADRVEIRGPSLRFSEEGPPPRVPSVDELVVQNQSYPLPAPASGMASNEAHVVVVTTDGSLWIWDGRGEPRTVATHLPLGPTLVLDGETIIDLGNDQVVREFATTDLAHPTELYRATSARLWTFANRTGERAIGMIDGNDVKRSIVLAGAATIELAGMVARWLGAHELLVTRTSGQVAVVDATTGRTAFAIDAHRGDVSIFARDHDLATASRDGAAFLWDLSDPYLVGHTGEVIGIVQTQGQVVTASHDGAMIVWPKREVTMHVGHEVTVLAQADGDSAIAGDAAGNLVAFTANGGIYGRAQISSSSAPITAIATSDRQLLAGTADGALQLRDTNLQHERALAHETASPSVSAVALDSRYAAAAFVDGSLHIYDLAGTQLASRADPSPVDEPGDHEGASALAFAGDALLASRPGGPVEILSLPDLRSRGTIEGRFLARVDTEIVTALGDGTVLVTDAPGSRPRRLAGAHTSQQVAAIGPSIATGGPDGIVHIFAGDHERLAITGANLGAVTALAWRDEDLVVGYASGATRVYPTTPASALAAACKILDRFSRACRAPDHTPATDPAHGDPPAAPHTTAESPPAAAATSSSR